MRLTRTLEAHKVSVGKAIKLSATLEAGLTDHVLGISRELFVV